METATSMHLDLKGLISLDDEVWSLLHIQMRLQCKEGAARRLVNEPLFPKPIINKERDRRWLAEDVKLYLKKKSNGEIAETKQKTIKTQYEPRVVSFK